MKITKDNYFKHIERIGFNKLPEALKQAHLVIMTKTDNGRDWNRFESDPEFKSVRELAFEKLAEFILHSGKLNGISKDDPSIKLAKEDAKAYQWMETRQLKMIYRLELDAELEGDGTPEERKIRRTAVAKELRKRGESLSGKEEYDPLKEIH